MAFKTMKKNYYIPTYTVLDFETGGLADKSSKSENRKKSNAQVCPVTQVGLIVVDGFEFKELDRYQSYVLPYDNSLEYQAEAEAITGVSKQDLYQKGKQLLVVVKEMSEIIIKHHQNKLNTVIIGQNIVYDIDFLIDIYKRTKTNISNVFNCQKFGDLEVPRYIELIDQVKVRDKSMMNYKLGTLCKAFDVEYVDGHDAMNDIAFTLEIFKKIAFSSNSKGDLFEKKEQGEFRKTFQF